MAQSEIKAGSCGFSAIVKAEKVDKGNVRIIIESKCDKLPVVNPVRARLQLRKEAFVPMIESMVNHSVSEHIMHPYCPVPSVFLINTIEVQLGIALPREATFGFEAT